jgi:hypothetical protein
VTWGTIMKYGVVPGPREEGGFTVQCVEIPEAIRFADRPRDPNRNQKSFRKNPGPVFFPKAIREIHIRIGSRFLGQNRSAVEKPVAGTFRSRSDRSRSVFCAKTGSRFADQNRSAIFMVRSGSGFYFSIAIPIAIENRSGKTRDRFYPDG